MKKIVCVLLTLLLLVSGVVCSAQTVEKKDLGVRFVISDDWSYYDEVNGVMMFESGAKTKNEGIGFAAVDVPFAYDIDWLDQEFLKETASLSLNDDLLKQTFVNMYGKNCNIKTSSVLESYEYYNGVKYYRYEKDYIVSSAAFLDTEFYATVFLTAKNGKVYMLYYMRDMMYNNFSDIVDMLNSISYEPGEIKIKINGARIYPDTVPVLVEGRTLVPIRAVAERMGYIVDWDGEYGIVSLYSPDEDNLIQFAINESIALRNGSEEIALDVPAVILDGRTYLPLRAVAEAMDAKVNWNGNERTVEIVK